MVETAGGSAVERLTRPGWSRSRYPAAIAAAVAVALVVALRNHYGYRLAGARVPFWEVFVGELPAWLVWALLLPWLVVLARRFPPFGSRRLRNAALHVVAGLVASFLVLLSLISVRSLLPTPLGPVFGRGASWIVVWQIYVSVSLGLLFIYGTIVGMVLAWTYHREEQDRRMREATLETMLAQAERNVLRMQIHPHFLFNTLHAISALVLDDPHGARRMVVRLSELLRLSLDDDARHEVSLEEEMAFLGRYLEIQQIRFGERLRISTEIHPEARDLLVPRLFLQPLVENALQHGIAQLEEGGSVGITARLDAAGSDSPRLVMEIVNDGVTGAGPRRSAGGSGRGVGMRNVASRLQQLYGGLASLDLRPRPEGGAVVRIQIPAHSGGRSAVHAGAGVAV